LLIENPAVFHVLEKLGLELSLAIYSGGRCSNRFLAWLATNAKTGLKIVHLPDYDPLGLTEFLRLYERIGETEALLLPITCKYCFAAIPKAHCSEMLKISECSWSFANLTIRLSKKSSP
jgi:hypothetical protein